MSKKTDNSWIEKPDVVYVDPVPQPPQKKKGRGCLVSIIIAFALFFGSIVYGTICFSKLINTEYKTFDDKKIAFVESTLECKLPDGVKPVHYTCNVGAGDAVIEFKAEGISSPDDYLAVAYKDVNYKTVSMDELSVIDKNKLSYDRTLTEPDVIVRCEFEKPEDGGRYLSKCLLAFYKDGDSWKLKQYASNFI